MAETIIRIPGKLVADEYGTKLANFSDLDNDVYGPYVSVAAAHAALSSKGLNTVGTTVGISGLYNTVVEYWYQGGTEQANLIKKVLGNNERDAVSFDGFIPLEPVTIIEGSISEPDAILYSRNANRFVAKKDNNYYDNWEERVLYNNGNEPYTSKLYPYNGKSYTWDGTTFKAEGAEAVIYEAQTLTAQQKEQAAQNIGLDVAVKGDVQQSLSDAQKVQAQNNMLGKAYAPAQFSGLGKKVLSKNMQPVGGVQKNVMMQAFFQDSRGNELTNTVFVIQYDYVLGENITVPEGCILEFDGGSIGGNKTITFNNTSVLGSKSCFKNNVTLAGTVRETFNASWIVWDNSYTSANMNIFGCLFAITNTTGEIVWDIPSLYILFNGQPIVINKGKEYNFNGLHLYIKNVTSASHLFTCSTTAIVTDYTKISDILASSICADKMVMLIVEDQTPLYQRYGYQYAYYRSDVLMAYNGNLINYPILDYDNDPDTAAKISYVTDLAPITLRNLTIERSNDSTYILEIFRAINLAQVTCDNVKIISYNDATLANEYMFYMEHCYDIKLTNISINTTYSVGGYGYAFSLFFCSRVLIENADIASPWHNTGCRGVNGLVIKDSSMNFDCHVYGKDFSFENCYINKQFNSVDFVTGIMSFNNCQFRNCVPLQISEDHVADLPLEVVFDNCSFENCDYLFFIYQFHAVQNLRELASMHMLPTITVRNSFIKNDNATYIAAAGVNYPDTYGVYTGKQINLITENVTVLAGSLKGMNIPQWDIVKYWYINNVRCSDNNSQFIIADDIDSLSCTNSTMTIKTDSTASRLNPMFSIAHSVVRPFNIAGNYNTEYSLSCCSVQCYKVADRNLYAIGAAFTKFDRCIFEVTGGAAYLLSFFSNYIYDLNCCYFEDPVMIGASYADTTAKERLINALNKAHLVVGYRYYNATSGTDAIFVKNVWNLLPNEYTALQNSNLKYTGILFVNGTGYKYIVNSVEVTQEAYMQVVMGITSSN